jgi:polyhydroxyalkanoate synthesis regulator phasin
MTEEKTLTERVQIMVEDTGNVIITAPGKMLQASRGAWDMTREEADRLLERGVDLFEELVERGEKVEQQQSGRINRWLKGWQKRSSEQIHVAEEQLEQRVQGVLRALHLPSADEVTRLDKEIDKIGRKLDSYLKETEQSSLPIEGYAHMTAKEITPLLDGLDAQQLEAIREFETTFDNRKTVLKEIDHRLAALQA